MGEDYEQVTAELRRRLGSLQALEDAIAFRLARVAVPCLDCEDAEDGKCDDHACDLMLIAAYRRKFEDAEAELEGVPVSSGSPQIPSPLAAISRG